MINIIYILMNLKTTSSLLTLFLLAPLVLSAIDADKIKVPGYPDDFKSNVYSGLLPTTSQTRKLHYVFVESQAGKNAPITLWLNGGPGCSSLLGFLQQMGPYYLIDGIRYKKGDPLIQNPFSWHKVSHLLFIESPAGVGFSINTDPNFIHTDITTANDNFYAISAFFDGYSEYRTNNFWLAGQSYAGKYIPDLAELIDHFNNNVPAAKAINLKGLFVGNGIISFENGNLQKSSIEFMVGHEFIDPDLMPYYRGSCLLDAESAGCRYFKARFTENIDEINPYNVYSYCFYNDSFNGQNGLKNQQSQASILQNIVQNQGVYAPGKNGATCAFFDGLADYFTANAADFKMKGPWDGPCSDNVSSNYRISTSGSFQEYKYLITKLDKYNIILYSGDWDDVVPYTDTLANLDRLGMKESSVYTPFFAQGQHAGFTQVYNGILFAVVKGASHQVPQSKRAEAYELFKMAMDSHNADSVYSKLRQQ